MESCPTTIATGLLSHIVVECLRNEQIAFDLGRSARSQYTFALCEVVPA
jgi:hypothetical protein